MKKQIWKFPLVEMVNNIVEMPIGAQILDLQIQGTVPCIWALVDPEADKVYRHFKRFATRETIEEIENVNLEYVGTFQLFNGNYVFHMFEVSLV